MNILIYFIKYEYIFMELFFCVDIYKHNNNKKKDKQNLKLLLNFNFI